MAFGDYAALLTDFTGVDENPLSDGGNWSPISTLGTSGLKRISNTVGGVAAGDCGSYWIPSTFGPDVEAYLTMGTVGGSLGIFLRVQQPGGSNTFDGYRVRGNSSGSAASIERMDNATGTPLSAPGAAWAAGDLIGMRCTGSRIELWRKPVATGIWGLLASATDTTYPLAGNIGVYANGTVGRADDFFVGNFDDPDAAPAEFPARHLGP